MVMVFGEITTKANVDYEAIVRKVCKEIGFTSEDVGLDADKCKVGSARKREQRRREPQANHRARSGVLDSPYSTFSRIQVLVHIEQQSPDIGQGVHGMGTKSLEEIGAGDQGHMFGYATDETPELMPLTHVLATKLGYRLTEVRKDGTCPWLRPDGKTQVGPGSGGVRREDARVPESYPLVQCIGVALFAWSTTRCSCTTVHSPSRAPALMPSLIMPCIDRPPLALGSRLVWPHDYPPPCPSAARCQVTVEYKREADGSISPIRVHTILISTQHSPDVTNEKIRADLLEHVIKPVVPEKYLDDKTIFHLNPSGRFVIGGPHGDAGLTGRKIIIDTYGGWGAHGGGAFSGKDPTKVDRSGAYIARQAAKSVVAAGLAKR